MTFITMAIFKNMCVTYLYIYSCLLLIKKVGSYSILETNRQIFIPNTVSFNFIAKRAISLTASNQETINDGMTYVDDFSLRKLWTDNGYNVEEYSEEKALAIMFANAFDDDDLDEVDVSNFSIDDNLAPASAISESFNSQHNFVRLEEKESITGKSVGIDLGTTNSVISVIEGGVPVVIPVLGHHTVPSVVSFLPSGDVYVGELARRQQVLLASSTYSSVKRVIGRTVKQVKDAGERLNILKVDPDSAHKTDPCALFGPVWPNKKAKSTRLSPEAVSAEVLRVLIKAASEHIGAPVSRAVVTVPAYFLPMQCEATKRAAILAGLDKVKVLREPEAAALAYGLREEKPQLVLVVDLGGGTYDVSVLEVGGGFVEVLATNGDAHLGGNDFDRLVASWLESQFLAQHSSDGAEGARRAAAVKDPVVQWRLLRAAEDARIRLSSELSVDVDLPLLVGDKGLRCALTRKQLETLCRPLLDRLLRPLRQVAVMAGVNLRGDSGQQGYTEGEYDGESPPVAAGDFSSQSVKTLEKEQTGGRKDARARQREKCGASRGVRQLQKQLGDPSVALFPRGAELNRVLLVGGVTRMPMVRRLIAGVTGKAVLSGTDTDSGGVDPDLAVSLGAAVYAGVMDGDIQGLEVMSAWQAAMYKAFYQLQQEGVAPTFETEAAAGATTGTATASDGADPGDGTLPMSLADPQPAERRLRKKSLFKIRTRPGTR